MRMPFCNADCLALTCDTCPCKTVGRWGRSPAAASSAASSASAAAAARAQRQQRAAAASAHPLPASFCTRTHPLESYKWITGLASCVAIAVPKAAPLALGAPRTTSQSLIESQDIGMCGQAVRRGSGARTGDAGDEQLLLLTGCARSSCLLHAQSDTDSAVDGVQKVAPRRGTLGQHGYGVRRAASLHCQHGGVHAAPPRCLQSQLHCCGGE